MEPTSRVVPRLPVDTHLVTSVDSPEFSLLSRSIGRSTVVGLDAEWRPFSRQQQSRQHCGEEPADPSSSSYSSTRPFPTVTVLQIACRCPSDVAEGNGGGGYVFVVDLLSVPAAAVHEMLREMFVSPNVVKLGFRFKQDLVYLSSTFEAQGCRPGFDRVEPFLDIISIYHYLKTDHFVRKIKEHKSLSTICREILGVSLSKELQCSDWSYRPLTGEQISYAAADAYYLIEIFDAFVRKFTSEGLYTSSRSEYYSFAGKLGLKEIIDNSVVSDNVLGVNFCEASLMLKSFSLEILSQNHSAIASSPSYRSTLPLDATLTKIVELYGGHIVLNESDRKPRTTKKKMRKRFLVGSAGKERAQLTSDWEGPPPWDPSLGGDGRPKFLCDVMVEGLAKHLRCVGIDASTPSCRRPEPRQLINQALKEKRVLLTRDAKLMQHRYLIENQIYKVKNLLKNDQLLEVIEIFQLNISEDRLMSRCTKCNGEFIQKPLSIEEAVVAARGFQRIPNCLFKQDLEFWRCTDCNQLYWEGTQYHNAVQKFMNVCKLKE